MSGLDYVNSILSKYDKNFSYSQNEETAFNNLKKIIQDWFNSKYNSNNYLLGYNSASLEIQKSGSRAKGTAIKGSSDMDMFLSITDKNNDDKLKNYYDELFDFLKSKSFTIRKQNVSLGVNYYNCDIDVVPAKKTNYSSYSKGWESFNDHWLWSNKKQTRTLTNIQKHIDLVKNGGLQKEIMLTKIWRNNHGLDFPSIYIELMVSEALKSNRKYNLASDFITVLTYIRDNILNKKVVDPSNSNNIISESLSALEKENISKQAANSLLKEYWEKIIW